MDLNYSMKIMIIGDESVGKSNFMAYFTDNDFNCNYIATIGIDLRVKIIEIGNIFVKLHIWDAVIST